uniref:Uncharacterized protein n=1 Tax=Parastrongyloides trichosuri TaxID=131310 RepID=A0A0N4ZPS1_PARTI
MKEDAQIGEEEGRSNKEPLVAIPYEVPGPQEPLPGRSHYTNYFPLFPLQNSYVGGVELDPSISRHIGGDLNIPIPSWGLMDINGDFFNRIKQTVYKYGYNAYPVNMLNLKKEDLIRLMNSPSFNHNREIQPTIPLVKLPRDYVPLNCKAPLCNPYTYSYGFGFESDLGGSDGVQGNIDVPIPISKDIAYRYPLGGNIYYALDNITITWGHNLSPVDPYTYLFNNNDIIVNTRNKRSIEEFLPTKKINKMINFYNLFSNLVERRSEREVYKNNIILQLYQNFLLKYKFNY